MHSFCMIIYMVGDEGTGGDAVRTFFSKKVPTPPKNFMKKGGGIFVCAIPGGFFNKKARVF